MKRLLKKRVYLSNRAHRSLMIQSGKQNDHVTSVYHQSVMLEQQKKNRLLTKIEKQQIFNKYSKIWGRK